MTDSRHGTRRVHPKPRRSGDLVRRGGRQRAPYVHGGGVAQLRAVVRRHGRRRGRRRAGRRAARRRPLADTPRRGTAAPAALLHRVDTLPPDGAPGPPPRHLLPGEAALRSRGPLRLRKRKR